MVSPMPFCLLLFLVSVHAVQLLLRYGIAGILVMYLRMYGGAYVLNHSFKNWMVGQK